MSDRERCTINYGRCAGPYADHEVVHIDTSRTGRWCVWTTSHHPDRGNHGWMTVGRNGGRYFDTVEQAERVAKRWVEQINEWGVAVLAPSHAAERALAEAGR